MRILKLFFNTFLLVGVSQGYGQLATLPPSICESYNPAGWIMFNPGSIDTTELFTDYKSHFYSDSYITMVKVRSWDDSWLNFNHQKYVQKYMGIPIEGCSFIQHADANGNLVYANGKICSNIGQAYPSNIITAEAAIDSILANFEYNQWSWDSPQFEAQYKSDLEDTLATSYPSGELVFTTKNWQMPITYNSPSSNYRLAWKFDLYSLVPSIHFYAYVDASTGEVLKYLDQVKHDGTATIPYYGTQTIDTRWEGGLIDAHVLHTNDAGRNVHSKYDDGLFWGSTNEIEDSDGTWGTSEQGGTSAHWSVTKAWDYFKNRHDRNGLDGSGGKVRVLCESTVRNGAWYDNIGGIDRIFVGFSGEIYNGELSILAHEFTHGVNKHEGGLEYVGESGALDESFADIFGFLARNYVTGSMSWEIGIPVDLARNRRNLQNPKSLGIHYDIDLIEETVTEGSGQPNTYGGEFWFPGDLYANDNGGVHINSGVQNQWFHNLCQGRTGENDLENSYVVYGIGITKAAELTYYNLTNNMGENSQYIDARIGAIFASILKWGECSFEHIQTQNAWYSVGVGESSTCLGAAIEESDIMSFKVYPNPTNQFASIIFYTEEPKTIQIFSNSGQLLKTFSNVTGNAYTIDVSLFPEGSYFVSVIGNMRQTTVLIKN